MPLNIACACVISLPSKLVLHAGRVILKCTIACHVTQKLFQWTKVVCNDICTCENQPYSFAWSLRLNLVGLQFIQDLAWSSFWIVRNCLCNKPDKCAVGATFVAVYCTWLYLQYKYGEIILHEPHHMKYDKYNYHTCSTVVNMDIFYYNALFSVTNV